MATFIGKLTFCELGSCLSGPFGDIDKKMLAQLAAEAGLIESVGSGSEDPTQLPSLGFPYQVKLRKGVRFKTC